MAANADALFDELGADDGAPAAAAPAAAAAASSSSSSSSDEPDGPVDDMNPDRCGRCLEMVDGPFITAVNRKWHPEHFVCTHCAQPFPNGEFFEANGKPYCAADYHANFGARCKGCGEVIEGRCITAMNAKWHADHFVCIECKKSLAGGSFVEYEDQAHCKPCAREKKAAKNKPVGAVCARCKENIDGEFITLQGQKMHPHHFSCHKCKAPFKGNNCHEYEGRLYCEPHFKELQASTCAQCRKPITGRAVTALGRQWHPEHFCCAHCETPFAGANYLVKNNRAYCEPHYVQLFGKSCTWCRKPIQGQGAKAAGGSYHPEHFRCACCDSPLPNGVFVAWEGKPCCKRCYGALPREIKEREAKIMKVEMAKRKAAGAAAE